MAKGMNIKGLQQVQAALNKEISKLKSSHYALVGIHEDAGMVENGQMTVAQLGAIQHFGADINHPGGTRYVIGDDGKARFVSNSFTGPVSGVTQPHAIKIPARRWLDTGAESGTKEILGAVRDGIKDGRDSRQIIAMAGNEAEGAIRQYMRDLKSPPNAASTVRKKGSNNPLIDSGNLVQSVTSKVTRKKPQEGL